MEISEKKQHPLADSWPSAMPLPAEETNESPAHPDKHYKGYYLFEKEVTVTGGFWYGRNDKRIEKGREYSGEFIAVRGDRKLLREYQTVWAGTLLEWTEKNMNIVEQGRLPGSSAGWKLLERLFLQGKHFIGGNNAEAFSAMRHLSSLKDVYVRLDKFCQKIPEQLYRLSQVKNLYVYNEDIGGITEDLKWSITHVSPDIVYMTSLENIRFSFQSELIDLPDELFELPNLASLSLGGCWKLSLSMHQVRRICELVEAGVSVDISPLNLSQESCRIKLLQAVNENGGVIDFNGMKRLNEAP